MVKTSMPTRGAQPREEPSYQSDDDDRVDVAAAQRLQAYGEKFMSMFGDYIADEPKSKKTKRGAADSPSSSSGADGSDVSDTDSEGSGDEELEEIFNGKPDVPLNKYSSLPKAAVPTVIAPSPSPPSAVSLKAERKRFMSHKAAKISAPRPGTDALRNSTQSSRRRDVEGDGLTQEEFQQLQREVLVYGASALDKKSKRQFDAAMLVRSGSKVQKGPRIPASIGIGMAKKQAQRQAKAEAEGLAAGMGKPKGKKKSKEVVDRGLGEDGGAFRQGVFKLTKKGSNPGGGKKRRR